MKNVKVRLQVKILGTLMIVIFEGVLLRDQRSYLDRRN